MNAQYYLPDIFCDTDVMAAGFVMLHEENYRERISSWYRRSYETA